MHFIFGLRFFVNFEAKCLAYGAMWQPLPCHWDEMRKTLFYDFINNRMSLFNNFNISQMKKFFSSIVAVAMAAVSLPAMAAVDVSGEGERHRLQGTALIWMIMRTWLFGNEEFLNF